MSRYIDADAFENQVAVQSAAGTIDTLQAEAICKIIDSQPTADVEPVRHAHWITYISSMRKCSLCDSVRGSGWMHYCPNCGAKMDESVKQ